VLTKTESKKSQEENNTEEEDLGWYQDIEFKYEYDHHKDLFYLFGDIEEYESHWTKRVFKLLMCRHYHLHICEGLLKYILFVKIKAQTIV
jgi:hypothetical protein